MNFFTSRSKNGAATANYTNGKSGGSTKHSDSLRENSYHHRNKSTMLESSEDQQINNEGSMIEIRNKRD